MQVRETDPAVPQLEALVHERLAHLLFIGLVRLVKLGEHPKRPLEQRVLLSKQLEDWLRLQVISRRGHDDDVDAAGCTGAACRTVGFVSG